MTTQNNMDTIQLTIILRKDRYTRSVFQGVYPSDKLPTSVFILLDHTGLRFISPKKDRENSLTLMDYL